MDLGIAGKRAIIGGASRGLGKGCALALAGEGVDLVIIARGADALEATAEEIRAATGVTVTPVAADIKTEAGRDAVLAACASPDILVTNAGGPPTGDWKDWDRDIWAEALAGTMLSAIAMIRATIDGMSERGFGRIVNVTSNTVKAPARALGLSNGARSGLTGFVAGLAREVAHQGVTINNLLPGGFMTDRMKETIPAQAKAAGISVEQALEARKAATPAGRFGTIEEFGAACAYFCSEQAGYVTGQNLLIDGGAYPGTF